jgi:hypothetical protein
LAVQANRGWLVNLLAVFAGIHFCTQWSARLGATPLSVLLGALLMFASPSHCGCFTRSKALSHSPGPLLPQIGLGGAGREPLGKVDVCLGEVWRCRAAWSNAEG